MLLRWSRRSTRISETDQVNLGQWHAGLLRRRLFQQRLVGEHGGWRLFGQRNNMQQRRNLRPDGFDGLDEFWAQNDGSRLGVIQNGDQLFGGIAGVDGNHHQSCSDGAIDRLDALVAVIEKEGDPISFA
jgi:hypothetical protein